jgi:hypothetical protein
MKIRRVPLRAAVPRVGRSAQVGDFGRYGKVMNMTMILTCLAKDFIVQTSDRRLSTVVDKKVRMVEDHSNKALIYSNHFVFAYTGLARLPFASAIDWAAQQLSEKGNLKEAVLHLGNRASDLMNSNHFRNLHSRTNAHVKRLAFVGAGFADVVEEGGMMKRRPLYIVISNFRGEDGTWLEYPRNVFRVDFHLFPENRDFELFVAGQQLPKERQAKFTDILKRWFKRKVGPETIGRLLTREIQAIAETNEIVGKNIMCTFVPRAFGDSVKYHFGGVLLKSPVISHEQQVLEPVEVISVHHRFALPPPFDTPRFVYIRGDNKAFPYEGPVLVVPGNVMQMSMDGVNITIPPVIRASDPQAHTPL